MGDIMHGDVAYCRKFGHDWKLIDNGIDPETEMIWTHVKCMRCEINHILYSFFDEGDE